MCRRREPGSLSATGSTTPARGAIVALHRDMTCHRWLTPLCLHALIVTALTGCGDDGTDSASTPHADAGTDAAPEAGTDALPEGSVDAASDGTVQPDGDAEVDAGPTECNDGIDNDGDGLTDWQLDLGCTGPGDNSEGGNNNVLEDAGTVFRASHRHPNHLREQFRRRRFLVGPRPVLGWHGRPQGHRPGGD